MILMPVLVVKIVFSCCSVYKTTYVVLVTHFVTVQATWSMSAMQIITMKTLDKSMMPLRTVQLRAQISIHCTIAGSQQ